MNHRGVPLALAALLLCGTFPRSASAHTVPNVRHEIVFQPAAKPPKGSPRKAPWQFYIRESSDYIPMALENTPWRYLLTSSDGSVLSSLTESAFSGKPTDPIIGAAVDYRKQGDTFCWQAKNGSGGVTIQPTPTGATTTTAATTPTYVISDTARDFVIVTKRLCR